MPYLEIDSKGQKVVSRVENYVNYHAGFETLLRGPTVIDILEQLSGEKMHLFKVSIYLKLNCFRGTDLAEQRALCSNY